MVSGLRLLPLVLIAALVSCAQDPQDDNGNLVRTIEEFDEVVATLQPGDKVVLANVTWTDV